MEIEPTNLPYEWHPRILCNASSKTETPKTKYCRTDKIGEEMFPALHWPVERNEQMLPAKPNFFV